VAVRPVNLARLIASMVGQPGAPFGTAASRFGRTLASSQGTLNHPPTGLRGSTSGSLIGPNPEYPDPRRRPAACERRATRNPRRERHSVGIKVGVAVYHNPPESTNDSRSAAIGAAHEIGPLRKPTACLLTLAPMQCCETCVARCCCDGSSRQTARGRTGYDVSALGRASAVCPL
jgi:hypothetical protein